jgi:hypothetical protein
VRNENARIISEKGTLERRTMVLNDVLVSYGINITSAALYDLVKHYLLSNPNASVDGLHDHLASHLKVEGADVASAKIIEFLARSGNIEIKGASVHSTEAITYSSSPGTSFSIGSNVRSSTGSGSSITTENGASVKGKGGGAIEQTKDGSIIFKA